MESNDTIQVHSNSRVNKVSFEEMENFIQKNAKNTIPDYLKPNNLNKNTEQYITAIDTADIIKVVHNDITSFTLKVNTLGDKDFTFSNLVINVHNDNIEEYIYHYIPDAQWLKNYIASKKGDYQGILKITDINGNDTISNSNAKNSTTCMVEMHVPCFGAGCPCSDYNGVTYYIMATCTTGGGGSSGGSTGGNPGGPPSGGGGGTVPNVPTTEQINNFIAFLSPSTHDYITQNIDALTDIRNYFIQNGVSPKHQSFITSILEYVENRDMAWSNFSPIFASATAFKKQNPDSWAEISSIQNFAFDFMLQNSTTTWTQFQNWLPYTSYFLNKFNEDSNILSYFLQNNINTNFNALSVDYKTRMSQQELQMYNNLSIIQQFFYLLSANTAEKKAQQKYPNSVYNGKGDAYRHTMWNAYSTRYIGKETTEQLTTAHENRPPDPNNPYGSKENEMDLYNNYMGRGIGYSSPLSIEHYVDLWLTNGNLYYLSNLEGGLPSGKPTINSQLIPTNQ
jgi:hypothetical protein